jgi:hypothetical protein
MIVAHIMGIPVEESVLQLAPAGAVSFGLLMMRERLARYVARRRRH